MRLLCNSILGMIMFMTFHEQIHAQLRIHSYGIHIANSMNGISVGYQDFESIGMKTNFISKGQPEFSLFNPMTGISLIAEYDPLSLLGRISLDNRSGIIEDENVQGSLVMQPNLSYLTFESALMIRPMNNVLVYGGPSLSMLLKHSIGKIGDKVNENQLSNMTPIIPGIFAGLSAEFITNHVLFDKSLHIAPFLETSLIFNQRKGEYPENQDGFDNIWSTFSMRSGISLSLNHLSKIPQFEAPFTLHIPSEMSGKRAMNEYLPLLMQWNFQTFLTLLQEVQQSSQFQNTYSALCTQSDPLFHIDDIKKQRICIEKRSIAYLMHHIKETSDTCIFTICSDGSFQDIQNTVDEMSTNIFQISPKRIQFEKCTLNHEHREQLSAKFISGQLPMISMDFNSISPPENVIICTVKTPELPNEWFIDIAGPQQYKKSYGPFTNQSVHLDGSELLQGEAGAGAYEWTIRYVDERGQKQSFSKDFRIRISSENKMKGESFTYIPILQSDSLMKSQISQDLKQHLRIHDEILLIIDSQSTQELRLKTNDILDYIRNEIKKLRTDLRKEISFIEKGKENALYDIGSDWGKIYEQGIRMEIIH